MKKAAPHLELLIQTAFDCAGIALGMTDPEGRFLKTNAAFTQLLGYTDNELLNLTDREVTHPDDREFTDSYMTDLAEGRIDFYRAEKRCLHKSGDTVWVDVRLTAVRDRDRALNAVVGALVDVTEKKRVEEQLLASQKMEAIGMLAGGIAHDFNNILATILGYASFLKGKVAKDDLFFGGLTAIEDSAVRASELTSQILAYSRGAKVEISTFSINHVVGDVYKLVQKTFNKSIRVVLDLEEGLNSIDADIAQMKLMLLNLCINARDVMPRGGVLTIKTCMSSVPDDRAGSSRTIPPGRYVGITVSDTGPDMGDDARRPIFESRSSGKTGKQDSGFALSVAYEIVKRHGGWIDVTGAAGGGTEFTVLLPASEEKRDEPEVDPGITLGGSETVLVIDDEVQIVRMLDRLLTDAGYRVLHAHSGADGIRIFKKDSQEIDLVLLDIMMPGMGGEQVMEQILRLRPDTKILVASGLSDREHNRDLIEKGAAGFIGKPFVIRDLLKKIRGILG
jgi:two-component system, cell cycle sensor histidine kinase and response regulator CckA